MGVLLLSAENKAYFMPHQQGNLIVVYTKEKIIDLFIGGTIFVSFLENHTKACYSLEAHSNDKTLIYLVKRH